jgi:beta-ureidopropionase / N-carbamoyl-L-amino-acid hydrolase
MMVSGIVCNDFLPEAIAKNFKEENLMQVKECAGQDHHIWRTAGKEPIQRRKEKQIRTKTSTKPCLNFTIEQGPSWKTTAQSRRRGTVRFGHVQLPHQIPWVFRPCRHVPDDKRHDALFAAAQALFISTEEIDKLGRPELVYTTGEIVCLPNVHTVIPNYVDFSIDVRHEDPKVLEAVMDIIKTLPEKTWAGCRCEIAEQWKRDTVYWDKKLVNYVHESADELGIANMPINSGAGHDAQFASYVIPTTMIFARTKDGLSHCEEEYVSVEDCTDCASVLLNAVLKADAE